MSQFLLALDQGTTSSRALVLNSDGEIIAVAQKEFTQFFPKPGWVEHDPEEIWTSQLSVAKSAIRKAKIKPGQIAAIGITNQRETTVVWNRRTGQPIHNAIVWQDRRTAATCDRLRKSKSAEHLTAATGLVIDAYFSGTKLAWLLDNVSGAREAAKAGELAFGTIDTWLMWKLTGGTAEAGAVHLTDFTNASRTMLFDIHTGEWDGQLLKALKVPAAVLPEVRSSSEVLCETKASILGASIPVAGVAGDQHAALFGQMCTEPGMVKNTYGTGCFMLMNTGKKSKPSTNNLLSTTAWKIGAQAEYAFEGSIFVAGAVVQWLRDGLGIIKRSSDVEALAAQVPDNGGVYLVPAFAGLGAPHWDAYARGSIAGLTRGATGAHIARAALEAIAYQTADVLDAMKSDAKLKIKSLRVDGGAAMNDLLMQFQADILGVPVVRPKVFESTALGAAYLAGLGVGVWKDKSELAEKWQIDRTFEPSMKASQVKELRAGWHKALERSKNWA
ncbi:glycerol kinase GlpK [Aureliella helgolandensis]|uniref:Glycerol kinase n=1 Tax=Aureliella helgolandensis TaxID=2527968 RepID=A0A518G5B0_9BACT|nr:glycerol kinase GlpK [Aureliella helgolandensis]QDV23787.1 Glycerol kinase [Aureliella helgolandensis]